VNFSQFWTEAHISRVKLHMKFSASKVDFSGLGSYLLCSTRPAHASVKTGYPFKKWWFLHYLLV